MRPSIPSFSFVLWTAVILTAPLTVVAGHAGAASARRHARPVHSSRGAVALHPVELPDGSGTMQLPAGWRITYASKEMVDASGPQGSASLGTWCQVFTPQGAAQMYIASRRSTTAPATSGTRSCPTTN